MFSFSNQCVTTGGVTVGSLDYAPDERRAMALASKKWECPTCGKIADMLLPGGKTSPNLTEEQSDLLRKVVYYTYSLSVLIGNYFEG